ncbi:kynureninase [Humibacter ginsenosidimutans]|uniref:Kynureninase n=1 Tax=Humibacter ginsenosidimutans TaxID=2599293 RepID=A0A5B8M3J2_9MICO|nr:aminotransferase class V-fold PLP-dependent enzyme [Humibacter ginsenosidimutans]QDZ14514.1 aminotransferase class V-fold PLP-dependent enzyme [Humibacter ginsenosidimutans]
MTAPDPFLSYARRADRSDGLAHFRSRFVPSDGLVAYFDGNSLGRPTEQSVERIQRFLTQAWAGRLIRGWDEEWMQLPFTIGDRLGGVVLGAAPGQTIIGDSTTVLLYKLARAAVDARRGSGARTEIVLDTDNFPTDRYVLDGIAAERGLMLRWIEADPASGVTPEQVAAVVGEKTALVVLSHVAYRSGFLAEAQAITRIAHDAGALVLWDLCHSVGSVPVELDRWEVDLAVGCTYKYLNGGPGSPAFAYVRSDLQQVLRQPIQGWMGAADVFAMGPEYAPADGMRRFLSGTPPIVGMLAMQDTLEMIEDRGIEAVRAKSLELTEFAITLTDEWLAPLGATLASPRDPASRGGHVTVSHPAMRAVTAALWEQGVIPDYRDPDGLRIGLSPLSTSFEETYHGMAAVRDALRTELLNASGLG